ncbi:MAG: acyl-CoA synthetase [Acidimicrobiales bacterium]
MSLGSWFALRAAATPEARALTFEGSTLTFAQLLGRVDRLAEAFRARGVRSGDRVGFLGVNQPAFLETLLAASRLGAIFVPLNFRLTGPELAYVIDDAGLHTLVADADHAGVVEQVRDAIPVRSFTGVGHSGDRWEPFESLIEHSPGLGKVDGIDPEAVAVIMYTSGTTGRPKGAMLTHANFWWNNTNGLHTLDVLSTDVTLVAAPLFHIGGLNVTTLMTWQKGGEVLLFRAFDPGACLEAIPRYGVTTMFGVPAMFLFLSQHPAFDSTDLTSLRTLICGGAPVPEPLIKLYNGRGIPIQQGYGLTETSPMVSFLEPAYALAKLGSAGRPPLFVDIRIAGPDGVVVAQPGERGEICTRGPHVMKGYWNKPEATAEAIDPQGWFHTGDAGWIDEDGFLYIADRVKDMVITGGENVYPAEVESVLYEHPAVAELAVIGAPDERWGEAVVAVVAVKAGESISLEDLREFGSQSLARYKLPTRLHLVDSLPRNPAGKVLKFELRERLPSQDTRGGTSTRGESP